MIEKVKEFLHFKESRKISILKTTRYVMWKMAMLLFIKINVDGAALSNLGFLGVGCIARDHDGHWLAGFTKQIGIGIVLHAEVYAIMIALQWALAKG